MRIRMQDERGQSSVEYALVLMAFLSIVLALGALWRVAHEGRMQDLVREASSHSLGDGVSVGLVQDVTAY